MSNSINLSDGKHLVAWEDNRFFSTGRPGSYTYGLVVEEDMDMNTHQTASPLSLNPYQGPHGGNYYYRAKLANLGESIMMNFHQYDGPYLQYVQMIDSDLNILGNENGTQVDGNGNDQKYSGLCSSK